jgi:hypothetical protein
VVGCRRHRCWPLLDGAEALIHELQPLIDEDRLEAVFSLPTPPPDEVRSDLAWFISNYGHAGST